MTHIQGHIAACRRPGELGVHSLDHFHLEVPDLKDVENFYGEFGLDLRPRGGRIEAYTFGHTHRWGTFGEGTRKKIGYLSFACFEEDLAGFRAHLDKLGVRRLDPPKGVDSNGMWFLDNDGRPIEIKVAEKSSPDTKLPFNNISVPAGQRGAPKRSDAPLARPRRFTHMLLFTPDVPRSVEFYTRTLGLRLSDRSGDVIAFTHAIHGCDHHLIAFVKSHAPGLHHLSWDMPSVDHIGFAAMRMADKGYTKGWGFGRHVLGSNYFHYVQDPWGSYAELSGDIDYVPHDQDWPAGDFEGHDSLFVWGPALPDDFVQNREAV